MKEQQFFTDKGVWFKPIRHRPTFTAQHTAQAMHLRGDEVAKTVVLKADGQYVPARGGRVWARGSACPSIRPSDDPLVDRLARKKEELP